ncbi:2Fe-2S iron-sulfur cluster-binding protein [Streptomyces sp. ITFR-6]|uniref:2Fe-2S iron-sulfur cluster-binding protein n=1 Tax=Streptomyces sp. ITFR-6 TaxID=3075197 RepID=UPI00288B6017|nr:2Fe-2S iron-sulfur cluster-binding protein [Streptomyces sp. ITFR-6]WNI31629.1 2Fe-2S iron-sulfur cluster-binding protein [Streptomyces sp. ITFR-6]
MSNEDHTEQHGGWEPIPQSGDYDGESTAFVHLPPEDLANIPLAAPGQGYVPPMILPLTPAAGIDPAATGSWAVRTPDGQDSRGDGQDHAPDTERPAPEAVHWPDPNQQQAPYGYPQTPYQPHPPGEQYPDRYREDRAATGQWNFAESAEATEPAGHTGQWQIPVADGDLPEESGEFSPSAAAAWYADRTPPATLPGGAPAPWATPEPEPQAADSALPQAPDQDGSPDAHDVPPEAALQDASQPAMEHPGPAEPVAEPVAEPSADVVAEPDTEATDTEAAPDTDATAPDATDTPAEADTTDPGVTDFAPEADPDVTDSDVTDPEAAPAAPRFDLPSEHPAVSYALHVNGVDRPVTDAWIGESLLYVLRERLGLAGAKDGCSQGECGACNVQVDGRLVASCLVPAATAAGSEVRTVEGLAINGEPSDVQRALADCGAVQCGFCIPGMAMTVHDLLEGNHAPSELETRQALCGNLCRCSGYRGVLDAVNEVIAGREAASAPAPESADRPTGQPAGQPTEQSAKQDEARIPHQAPPGAGSVQAHLQDGGMA